MLAMMQNLWLNIWEVTRMRKSRFLTFIVAVLVLVPCLAMFACGENRINPYEQINAIITEIQADESAYENGDILETGFNGYKIKNLAYKNDSGMLVEDGQVYNAIFAVSLDKIIKYNPSLENISANKLADVKKAYDSFEKAYNDFKGARERFVVLEGNANIDIYNGFYARYKEETKGYVGATCALARELLSACDKNYQFSSEDEVENAIASQLQWQLRYDNELIRALGDIKDLIFVSARGEELDNELLVSAKATLKNIATYALRTTYNIAEENKEKFLNISTALENERAIASQALKNFSLYELEREYNGSLAAYYRTGETKEFDYVQLNSYFANGGILLTYLTTINNY